MRTDHGALKWLMNFKNPEGQAARWIEILGIYDLEVEDRQGQIDGNPDGLSGVPVPTVPTVREVRGRDNVQIS